MITYDKFWEKAKERHISYYALSTKYGISKAQLNRLKHNHVVSTNTIDRLCNILQCDVGDIMEHTHDDNYFTVKER